MATPSALASAPVRHGRNAAATRARILAAAQDLFSRHGYVHAGMREIAAEAGINVALVARYFGSKEKLFEAALAGSVDAQALTRHDRATFGKRVVSLFVDNRREAVNPLMMLVQAAADPVAQAVALTVIRETMLAPMGEWLEEPHATARAAAILALCAGFFTYRNLLPLDPFTGTLDPAARTWLESALQAIVDGDGFR